MGYYNDDTFNPRIGEGQKTMKSKLHSVTSTLTILDKGGYTDDANFWVSLARNADSEEEEEEDGKLALHVDGSRRDYQCSTPGCLKSFLKMHNLERHEMKGCHTFRTKKPTLLDYSIDSFNRKVDIGDLLMGWALKVNAKEGITDLAYQDATDYFMKQRFVVLPRRAEPRAFSLMMEEMRTSELLTEKQLTGLFSRLETKRVSGVSVARKVRGRQTSKSSRKRRHPQSEDEEEAQASSAMVEEAADETDQEDDDPEEDEAEGKMDEEDLIRA